MNKNKWIWMPHPAHFICARDCNFHLATYVGKYIVSTVGELWPDRSSREIHAKVFNPTWLKDNKHLLGDEFDSAYFKKFGWEDIGADRKYETMVFKARKAKRQKDYMCCPYEIIVDKEVDFNGYNNAISAYNGHMKLCEKWSKKRK